MANERDHSIMTKKKKNRGRKKEKNEILIKQSYGENGEQKNEEWMNFDRWLIFNQTMYIQNDGYIYITSSDPTTLGLCHSGLGSVWHCLL